jgi:nucleoside 2-deoxyribosyltransferase
MKIVVCHPKHFDYNLELYQPLRESALNLEHEILLPHDPPDKDINTKDEIEAADLVVAEVSLPGTGLGMELGWADAAGKPVACFYRSGSQVSSSLKYISKNLIEYSDSKDFIEKLTAYLANKS